ncbi:MAG: excinuclease ATPase subunit [Oscillospiraceae bacterium]|nr:excinuclease ATPase subunit [Oscillospiraceae bacterium]
MSWGSCYMYYACPHCGKLFKYNIDLIPVFGARFGECPDCNTMGAFIKEGPLSPDGMEYEEVD